MSALTSQYDDSNEYQAMCEHFRKVATPTFMDDMSLLLDDDFDAMRALLNAMLDPTTPSWLFGSSEY